MKKVLFILHVPPPVHGSSMVGKYIKDSKLINETFDTKFVNLGTSKSVDEIGHNPLGKISRYLVILWKTIKYCVLFKPDICYIAFTVTGIGFYKDAPIALIAKLFRLKVVFHLHNKGVKTREQNFFDDLLYKLVFKKSEVILLSQYLYEDIEKYVAKDSVHYCPNGIPSISPKISIKNFTNNQPVRLLFLSNLIETKGVFILLDALKILKENLPQCSFHCTIVGGESDITAAILQNKINVLNLSEYVEYVGKKYDVEKNIILSLSDIFIFPTYYHNECFPLVLLEAMQFSLPLISTYEGGIQDIVIENETGFLVPQKDIDKLAEKLAQLISDPDLRKRMGEKGKERFEKEFTLKTFEKRVSHILTEISLK